MTTFILHPEFLASRKRTQRTLVISLILHLMLFAWLILRQELTPSPESIVEITWLDPAPVTKALASLPVPTRSAPAASKRPATPSPTAEKFLRRQQLDKVEPTPQTRTANRDRIKERVAALSSTRLPNSALATSARPSRSLLKSAPSAVADPGRRAAALDLKREGSAPTSPTPLKRGPAATRTRAPALALLSRDKSTAAAAIPDLETVARRTLEGAELAGEIANRPVLTHPMPVYPEWAKSQAVEATVTLYFVVLPGGRIKENIQVQKTAGFADFDQSAIAALTHWRFEPLNGGATQEQWGTITFRFRLRD